MEKVSHEWVPVRRTRGRSPCAPGYMVECELKLSREPRCAHAPSRLVLRSRRKRYLLRGLFWPPATALQTLSGACQLDEMRCVASVQLEPIPSTCLYLRNIQARQTRHNVALRAVSQSYTEHLLQLAQQLLCPLAVPKRTTASYVPACASASLYSLFAITISSCSSCNRVAWSSALCSAS